MLGAWVLIEKRKRSRWLKEAHVSGLLVILSQESMTVHLARGHATHKLILFGALPPIDSGRQRRYTMDRRRFIPLGESVPQGAGRAMLVQAC